MNALAIDFVADSRAFSDRKTKAYKFAGGVGDPLELRRPTPVRLVTIEEGPDRRPPALCRDPCPRCQTRGDLGCEHQRPFEPAPTEVPPPKPRAAPTTSKGRFTEEEDGLVVELAKAGLGCTEIGKLIGRCGSAIHSRLHILGRKGRIDPVHLPRKRKSRSLAPPASTDAAPVHAWRGEREWCQQCQRLVDRARAAACGSEFCRLRADAA